FINCQWRCAFQVALINCSFFFSQNVRGELTSYCSQHITISTTDLSTNQTHITYNLLSCKTQQALPRHSIIESLTVSPMPDELIPNGGSSGGTPLSSKAIDKGCHLSSRSSSNDATTMISNRIAQISSNYTNSVK
uniref:Uncharacterized protein n=1 Tax=Parascaris univalens TaxID=6257 RepID=A0A915B0Z1_PARUN